MWYKGKGRGWYLYGWVAILSGAYAWDSRDGFEKMEIRNDISHLLRGLWVSAFLHRVTCDITNQIKLKINYCLKIRKKILSTQACV
jgi:hypothetical protein